MNRTRFALSLLLISAWLGAAGHPARAAQLVALSYEEELYADVFTNAPEVAAQPRGPYVIAWDDDTLSSYEGYLFYRYTPAGEDIATGDYDSLDSPTGAPDVDAVTAGRQGFDVFWHTRDESPLFYRAHLNLRGRPVGKPVLLGGPGTEWVWQVRGNGLMAGWSLPGKHGIAARRLTASGQRTGPELRLNSRPVDHVAIVSVVGLADSSFVAVWLGKIPGNTRTVVLRARRFSPSGKPLGPDFDVNTVPLGELDAYFGFGLEVAAAPGGGFVVAWGLSQGTYLRWFNASGSPLAPEHRASAPGEYGAFPDSMAFDDAGNLLLLLDKDYYSLHLHLFDPKGRPLGSPVNVTSDDTTEPREGSLAWTGDSWLVTWVATIFPYDQSAIYVRRFAMR